MKKKAYILVIASIFGVFSILCGCSKLKIKKDKKEVKGEVTFITNRTGFADPKIKNKYYAQFKKKYPKIKVKIEVLEDYEEQMKARLEAGDYGDVLLIPKLNKERLQEFFYSLGKKSELGKKYNFLEDKSYRGNCYGIPSIATTSGIIINRKVWEDAGILSYPRSTEEFISDLKKIKAKNKVPLYLSFSTKYTLSDWNNNCISIVGDKNWKSEMTDENAPFSKGKPFYEVYNLLYQVVRQKLIDANVNSADWENAKQLIVEDKVGCMVQDSWAIPEIKAVTENKDNIAFIPFPVSTDGKQYSVIKPSYSLGINKESKNKKAAQIWLYWFINESGYSEDNDGISPLKNKKMPKIYNAFKQAEVGFLEENTAINGKENLWNDIDKKSGIGIGSEKAVILIIKEALTGKQNFENIMKIFNAKWKAARISLTV